MPVEMKSPQNDEAGITARLRADVRRRIRDKDLVEGQKLPSMRQMSEEYGCSLGVVQQAIIGLTGEGYLRSAPRKGVYVAKRRKEQKDLVLVLPSLRNETMGHLIRGVRDGIRGSDLQLVVQAADDSFEGQVHLLEYLQRKYVAGVVICPPTSDEYAEPIAKFLRSGGIACVQATHELHGLDVDTVVVDAFEQARLAAKQLLDRGHRRLIALGFSDQSRTHESRLSGAKAAFDQAGVDPSEVSWVDVPATPLNPDEPWRLAQDAIGPVLASRPDVTAVLASGDHSATATYRAAADLGRRIPDDLSVVCMCGDVPSLRMLEPALTMVLDPLAKVCERAVRCLLERMDNPVGPSRSIQLAPELVAGQSVRAVLSPAP